MTETLRVLMPQWQGADIPHAYPDITTPKEFIHAHTMVLGNLRGEGDVESAKEVKVKVKPSYVIFTGLQETTEQEKN